MLAARDARDDVWPSLPYRDWTTTLTTLHMWTQIIGKVKLELTPFLNDWWNVTFALTARGMTTGLIPFGQRLFQVDLDFIDHKLTISANNASSAAISLAPRSVADFYRE